MAGGAAIVKPRRLRVGDVVGVVAPAGVVDAERLPPFGRDRRVRHERGVLGERQEHYFNTVEATVKAVVYGIVLTAIARELRIQAKHASARR